MRLVSTRTFEELREVLKDPDSSGPNPVYTVSTDLDNPSWVNQTEIAPGRLGEEYTKTFGHYHSHPVGELYKVKEGEGVLILQKHKDVDEVLLIHAKAGDEILITPEYGHSWSNTGTTPLMLLDNWSEGHSQRDYEPIRQHQGMAYYIVERAGEPKVIPNPTYKNLPEPQWIEAKDLQNNLGRLE